MDAEKVKGKPLTKEETKFLLGLIERSKIIRSKTTNATYNKLKHDEWIRITDRFNAIITNVRRTPQQLRLKWDNLKKNSRKRSMQIKMNLNKTGGGYPDYIPPDEILDRVTGILESTPGGLTVPFGGDKEAVESDDGSGSGDSDSSRDGVGIGDDDTKIMFPEHALDIEIDPLTADNTENLTSSAAAAGRKKLKPNEGRTARNVAIAEYYSAKKQYLDTKVNNRNLQNENLELQNLELNLRNEKLLLETEKLKLEIKKLKEN